MSNRLRGRGVNRASSSRGGYDVIWAIGQSNALGYGATRSDVIDRVWPTGLKQLARNAPNADKLIDPFSTGTGTGVHLEYSADIDAVPNNVIDVPLTSARLYAAANGTARPIVIIPSAAGTTGFFNGNWNPGNTIYEREIARVIAFLNGNVGSRLLWIYWAQGESDANTNINSHVAMETYRSNLDAMIDDIRSRVSGASTTPFIVAGMVPGWVEQSGSEFRVAIQSVLAGTPYRKPYTAYIDPQNPSGSRLTSAGTGIHYDATDIRGADGTAGLAGRVATALSFAQTNLALNKDGSANTTSGLSFDSAIVGRYVPRTGTMKDLSGNGNDFTKVVGTTQIQDLINLGYQTIYQPGAGGFTSSVAFPPSSYTKMMWVNLASLAAYNPFLGSASGAGMNWLGYHQGNNKITAGHNNSYTLIQDTGAPSTNTWIHVAATYDSATSTMKLYRDGALVQTATSVAAPSETANLRIGLHDAGLNGNGRWDNVILCNRALTLSEVQEHRSATLR